MNLVVWRVKDNASRFDINIIWQSFRLCMLFIELYFNVRREDGCVVSRASMKDKIGL